MVHVSIKTEKKPECKQVSFKYRYTKISIYLIL